MGGLLTLCEKCHRDYHETHENIYLDQHPSYISGSKDRGNLSLSSKKKKNKNKNMCNRSDGNKTRYRKKTESGYIYFIKEG